MKKNVKKMDLENEKECQKLLNAKILWGREYVISSTYI